MEQLGLWRPEVVEEVQAEVEYEPANADERDAASDGGAAVADVRYGLAAARYPIADGPSPTDADRCPPIAGRSPPAAARRPRADGHSQLTDDQYPTAAAHSPTADRAVVGDGRVSIADNRYAIADRRAPSGEDRLGPARASADIVVRALARYTGRSVRCTFTQNRSTMISYRERHGGALDIRLHHMFLDAPDAVLAALAVFLTGRDKRAVAVIDGFIRASQAEAPPPDVRCAPRGRFHDLRALFDRLNAAYFHGACVARITWGSAGSRRYRRSIQVGCYVRSESLIRVHPSLDQAFVPEFYVAWIVFHEMLHEVFGVERHGGRHLVHPPEFVAIEQT
jgi:hypothetical protein